MALDTYKSIPKKHVEFDVMLTFHWTTYRKKPKKCYTNSNVMVTVNQHHSFIELPDSNYKPRVFDVRSGAISMSYMDYATPVQEQIKKRLHYSSST